MELPSAAFTQVSSEFGEAGDSELLKYRYFMFHSNIYFILLI